MSAHHLVLENQLGQRVRTFAVEGDEMTLIQRLDSGRVEAHCDLSALDEKQIPYTILKTVKPHSVSLKGLQVAGLGRLRLAAVDDQYAPTHELAKEEDQQKLMITMKKTAVAHIAVIAVILLASLFIKKEKALEEPQLVTITPPKKELIAEPKQKVAVSEKKIVQQKTEIKKVSNKTVIKPKAIIPPKTKVAQKSVIQNKKAAIVRSAKPQTLDNVGALAALGGLKNGTKGYQGLDTNSLKNIRSAGVGSGGGGVGANGAGGIRGVLPGSGLIAGSAGSGGRAEGAGGYGTKGAGGGRAGYGKISLVGNTSGISLPLDDEASIEGGLDRDQIAAVINRNKGQIIYCYEQGLQGTPSLNGRVSVAFVIGANGRITTAKVAQTSLRSAQVESCMIAKMKNWQFPRPVGNVNVDVLYPFELRRVSSR